MIRTILKWLLLGMILALILLWLWSGGWALIKQEVAALKNPIDILTGKTSGTYQIRLPFSPAIPQGPDISGLVQRGDSISGEDEGAPSQGVGSAYGVASPYQGQITLTAAHALAHDPAHEYVVITSHASVPVDISGWVLQSMLTARRAVLPQAAAPFVGGTINRVSPILLSPGQAAIIASGASPVGVSFEENRCTGYLAQTQGFDPALSNACPSPLDSYPESFPADQAYGASCFAYMRTLPQCEYVTEVPASLSASCRTLIANEFSYNGCVSEHWRDGDFYLGTWRVYLGSGVELWDNTRDIIRLTDANGQTVDAITY